MPQTSVKLFTAWAAKHKEWIALQDELLAAQRDGVPDAERLVIRVEEAKAASDRTLAAALDMFRSELRERGITE